MNSIALIRSKITILLVCLNRLFQISNTQNIQSVSDESDSKIVEGDSDDDWKGWTKADW